MGKQECHLKEGDGDGAVDVAEWNAPILGGDSAGVPVQYQARRCGG